MKRRTFEVGEQVEYRFGFGWTLGEVVSYDATDGRVGVRTKRGRLVTRPGSSVRPIRTTEQQQPAAVPLTA
jgi:hypothetical protein